LALADSQTEAIRVALASKVLVITGGPGVCKTTLVNSLLKILLVKAVTIALCAPTGRAAKRLSESAGLEAKTIHRLLETDLANRLKEVAPVAIGISRGRWNTPAIGQVRGRRCGSLRLAPVSCVPVGWPF
jgi:ATP-dependent exoDNAse (exonuclease V) alpha subunit